MRLRLLGAALLWALVASPASAQPAALPGAPGKVKLFLLIGQSNMAGRGVIEDEDKVVHPRVFVQTKDLSWAPAIDPLHFDKPKLAGVGLGSTFARVVADAHPEATIGVIPAAFGGTALDQWNPDGELYANAVTRTREAMKSGTLAGILWHQGEGDSADDLPRAYTDKFKAMIDRMRRDLDAPEVPVVVGELGRFRTANAGINAVLAQLPSHVSRCAFVSSEGLTDKDGTHFDSRSLRELGRRYAAAWMALAKAEVGRR
jgi:hypothetical protein